jgi:hypothetical protein
LYITEAEMEDCIERLVELEWQAFQRVHNVGGRADCQDQYDTFVIMRKSQFLAWDQATRASYLQDLLAAVDQGRNLLAEKYARMMAWTAPLEYKALEHALPPVSEEAAALVDEIASAQQIWQEAYARDFPQLAVRGRPEVDSWGVTGFETYLRGELLTYSLATLRHYASHVKALQEDGVNMHELLMEHTVKMYGYPSLAEAKAAYSR